MHITQAIGGVRLQVLSCTYPRFRISGMTGRIALKFEMWLETKMRCREVAFTQSTKNNDEKSQKSILEQVIFRLMRSPHGRFNYHLEFQ